jgi:hypothetical protein
MGSQKITTTIIHSRFPGLVGYRHQRGYAGLIRAGEDIDNHSQVCLQNHTGLVILLIAEYWNPGL